MYYTLTGTLFDTFCQYHVRVPILHGIKLKRFLGDCISYSNDRITQFLQNNQLHIANLPFHYILKVHCWINIGCIWRSFEYNEITVMFKTLEII